MGISCTPRVMLIPTKTYSIRRITIRYLLCQRYHASCTITRTMTFTNIYLLYQTLLSVTIDNLSILYVQVRIWNKINNCTSYTRDDELMSQRNAR